MAAVGRATVTVEPPMDADVSALNEALVRMHDLLANPTQDVNHDLLNLIGAIRGYGEMLYEDLTLLHPTLQASLPPLLSAVESRQTVTSTEGDPHVLTVSEAPGVILAVDDMPENRELISRLLSRAGHTVISAASGEEVRVQVLVRHPQKGGGPLARNLLVGCLIHVGVSLSEGFCPSASPTLEELFLSRRFRQFRAP